MTAADLDMARADLAPLFDTGYVREVMALYDGGGDPPALRTDDLDTALAFVADHDRAGAVGIYTGVNPLAMPPGRGRGKGEHVPYREALFLDFDVTAAKDEKRPATDAERRQAYEAAMKHAFPLLQRHGFTGVAQRIGSSGNGFYLLFALEQVPNDAEHRALIGAAVDALNAVMPAGIDVDRGAATDAVRVRRISGTVNRKHGGTGRCDLKHHAHATPLPVDVLRSLGSAGRQSTGPAGEGEARDPGAIVPTEAEGRLFVEIMRTDRGDGARHNTALAYGGFMAHSHIARVSALAIIRQVAADDRDIRDREQAVNDSYDRYEAGHPVGWKNMLPAGSVARLKAARAVMYARCGIGVDSEGGDDAGTGRAGGGNGDRAPVVLSLVDVEEKPIEWIWPGWQARAMLSILGGYGGDGKSTLTMALTAMLTRGSILPDGKPARRLNVLILAAEDDPSYAIKPRLKMHGADMARVFILKGIRDANGDTAWFNIARDVEAMREVIARHDIGLVIIDPLSSYMPKADRNSEGDVRDALMPLQLLMEETGVGVLGIMHVGKADAQRRAAQRLLGSTAFTALARCVWMVHELPDEYQPEQAPDTPTIGRRKVLGVVKANYSQKPPALAWSQPLDGPITWHGQSPIGIDEAFAADSPQTAPKTAEAEAFLLDFLKGGSKPATEVYAAAPERVGEKTLRRAADALGVVRDKDGFQGRWWWRLPSAEEAKGGKDGNPVCTEDMATFEGEPDTIQAKDGPEPFTHANATFATFGDDAADTAPVGGYGITAVEDWIRGKLKDGPLPEAELLAAIEADPRIFPDLVEVAKARYVDVTERDGARWWEWTHARYDRIGQPAGGRNDGTPLRPTGTEGWVEV